MRLFWREFVLFGLPVAGDGPSRGGPQIDTLLVMKTDFPTLGPGARVAHPEFGEGIATDVGEHTVAVFFRDHGDREISRSFAGLKILESPGEVEALPDLETVAEVLRGVLEEASAITHPVEMGSKWKGGTLNSNPKWCPWIPSFTKSSWCGTDSGCWSKISMPTPNSTTPTGCICNNTSAEFTGR